MAKQEDVQRALDRLNSGGIINLGGRRLKKKILVSKLSVTYGDSISDSEIDRLAEEILDSGRGELVGKLDSDLAMISGALSSVVSQAPALLAQMATIPASKISTTVAGPTVPNPIDIKNTLSQIKAQADTMGALLGTALGKVVELGISEEIPDSVLGVIDIIASIKNFPL